MQNGRTILWYDPTNGFEVKIGGEKFTVVELEMLNPLYISQCCFGEYVKKMS